MRSSSLSELNYQRVDRYRGVLPSSNDFGVGTDSERHTDEPASRPKRAQPSSKPLKAARNNGINLEVKNLLIDKNKVLLTKILHTWHVYALKQYKRRMEKKKAKKALK